MVPANQNRELIYAGRKVSNVLELRERVSGTHTARSLKIGIRTLQRKLKIYGVAPASRYLPVKCRDTGRVFASRAEAGLELFQNLCSEQRTAKVKQLVEYGQLEVL